MLGENARPETEVNSFETRIESVRAELAETRRNIGWLLLGSVLNGTASAMSAMEGNTNIALVGGGLTTYFGAVCVGNAIEYVQENRHMHRLSELAAQAELGLNPVNKTERLASEVQ